MTRGRFISLEGGEGAGKSTQARALGHALNALGIRTVLTREPGGSPGAEAIRELLLRGEADRWMPQAEALLFAAARAEHLARTILPAVERGDWAICDRFLDSSRAYQGGGQSHLSDADILALHRIGSGGVLPDRTLLLVLPGDEGGLRARQRDGAESDRIGGRDAQFHAAVAAAFAAIARAEPERVRTIDASGTPDLVTQRLLDALADLLP